MNLFINPISSTIPDSSFIPEVTMYLSSFPEISNATNLDPVSQGITLTSYNQSPDYYNYNSQLFNAAPNSLALTDRLTLQPISLPLSPPPQNTSPTIHSSQSSVQSISLSMDQSQTSVPPPTSNVSNPYSSMFHQQDSDQNSVFFYSNSGANRYYFANNEIIGNNCVTVGDVHPLTTQTVNDIHSLNNQNVTIHSINTPSLNDQIANNQAIAVHSLNNQAQIQTQLPAQTNQVFTQLPLSQPSVPPMPYSQHSFTPPSESSSNESNGSPQSQMQIPRVLFPPSNLPSPPTRTGPRGDRPTPWSNPAIMNHEFTHVSLMICNNTRLQKAQTLKKGKYYCTHCDIKFCTVLELCRHMDSVNVTRQFHCNHEDCPWYVCGFPSTSEWFRHTKSQHRRPEDVIECCICQKPFARRDSLKRHNQLVHENPDSRYNRKQRTLITRLARTNR